MKLLLILLLPVICFGQFRNVGAVKNDTTYTKAIIYLPTPNDTTDIDSIMVWISDGNEIFRPRKLRTSDLGRYVGESKTDTNLILFNNGKWKSPDDLAFSKMEDTLKYIGTATAGLGYYYRFINDSTVIVSKIAMADLGTGITGATDTGKVLYSNGKWKTTGGSQTLSFNSVTRTLSISGGNSLSIEYDLTLDELPGYYESDMSLEMVAIYGELSVKQTADADLTDLADGTLSASKVQYLSTVTSDVQTQINGKLGNNQPAVAVLDAEQNNWYNASDFFELIDAKSDTGHTHSGYAELLHTHSIYAPLSHEHSLGDIAGLTEEDLSLELTSIWDAINGLGISDISGLQTALDGKADTFTGAGDTITIKNEDDGGFYTLTVDAYGHATLLAQ